MQVWQASCLSLHTFREELHTKKAWRWSWSTHVSLWRNSVLTAILLKSKFFRNVMPCRQINTHPTFRKKKTIFSSLFLDCVAMSVQTIRSFETSVPIRRKLHQIFCNVRSTALCFVSVTIITVSFVYFNPYPTAFPYGNGMVLHFYQQQESSTTKTIHRVINKRLKTYV